MRRIHLRVTVATLALGPLLAFGGQQDRARVEPPDEYELERTVGKQLETPIRISSWKTAEPQQTNLFIYSVVPAQMDEMLMRRIANRFGVKGEVEQIKGDTLGNVGYWIREQRSATTSIERRVYCWLTMPKFGYTTGDDGYRYNRTTKTHEERGVPDRESAKAKAVELLPLLGLSTNDFKHSSDGRLKWLSSASTVGYMVTVSTLRASASSSWVSPRRRRA